MTLTVKEFNKQNSALQTEMENRMNEPENEREIIFDGVMKPELYINREIRLAWMLKEAYDGEDGKGGGWNYFDLFPEDTNLYEHTFKKGHKTTWHPMIYISYSVLNNFPKWDEMDYISEDNTMCEIVREVAFINSQKLPARGVTRTFTEDLRESLEKNSDLLKKQVELINPNVFIFGSTFDLYENILGIEKSQLKANGSCQYLINEDKLYVAAYHPAQTTVKREDYINDIIEVIKKWSEG